MPNITGDYISYGEPRVVRTLICNRIKLDPAYGEKMFPSHPLACCGVVDFAEPVLATYIDLDALIERAKLTPPQKKIVMLLMRGWSTMDIADTLGVTHPTCAEHFAKAVKKICAVNNERWLAHYAHERPE